MEKRNEESYLYEDNTPYFILIQWIVLTIIFLLFMLQPLYEATEVLDILRILIQMQVLIFSISIAITSFTFQVALSTYSPIILNQMYSRLKPLWYLFGFSIFYDLLLFTQITNSLSSYIMAFIISSSCFFASLSFIRLLWYWHNSISIILDPIKLYTRKELNDNLLVNFMLASLKKDDYEYIKKCINQYKIDEFNRINFSIISEENDNKVEAFINNLLEIGDIFIQYKSQVPIELIFNRIHECLNHFGPREKIYYYSSVLEFICNFVEKSVKNDLELSAIQGITSVYSIYTELESCFESFAENSPERLQSIGLHEGIFFQLSKIGLISSERKLKNTTNCILNHLNQQSLFTCTKAMLENVKFIGLFSSENRMVESTEKSRVFLENVALMILSIHPSLTREEKTEDLVKLNIIFEAIGSIAVCSFENGDSKCRENVLKSYHTIEIAIRDNNELHFSDLKHRLIFWEKKLKLLEL